LLAGGHGHSFLVEFPDPARATENSRPLKFSLGQIAEFIQQERFKHANPAKACFREGVNILHNIIIEGRSKSSTNLEGNRK
jgi:hypothetical protein